MLSTVITGLVPAPMELAGQYVERMWILPSI